MGEGIGEQEMEELVPIDCILKVLNVYVII